ncbi:MAG: bifunctional hydroxymethylpyrimidine kinase/phosphomethylpyrimidine kinase [Acidobacteriota bacterium]
MKDSAGSPQGVGASGLAPRLPGAPPRVLTIAGSDSGGGAGIQADLKTFDAFGVYGMSAITAITAQNTLEVTAVEEIPVAVVEAQIDAVAEDLGFDAVKIGMLSSVPLVEAVAGRLEFWLQGGEGFPIVLDPVMIAKSGTALLRPEAVDALMQRLVPLATVVTPNLPEAQRMTGLPTDSQQQRLAAARALLERIDRAGARRSDGTSRGVVIKGGHGEGEELVDLLVERSQGGEERTHRILGRRVSTRSTHGTGCTLSSAIAASLALGKPLAEAVEGSVAYVRGAIAAAFPLGSGHGPVDHLYRLRQRR